MRIQTIVVAVLLAGGCAVEAEGDEAEATSEAAQDLTSTYATGLLTCSSSAGCSATIAPVASNRSCFLSGVKGDLRDGSIYVTTISGNFTLRVEPYPGKTLAASATCVTNATTSTSNYWYDGRGAVSLGNAAGRVCELSAIYNEDGFTASADYVRTYQDSSGNWWLTGSMPGKNMTAHAICWDGGAVVGGWDYAWTSTTPVDVALSSGSNIACGLSKLGGFLTAATDLAQVYPNLPSTQWRAKLARTALQSYCFQ